MPDFFDVLWLRVSAVLPQAVAGFAVAGAFWLLAKFVGGIVMRLQSRVDPAHKDLVGLLADVAGWSLFLFGVVAGLGTAGVNVTALVTGLGLTGFALSIAFKDVLANLVAGVLILLFRPYARGDNVRIDKFQGKVVDINLRHTRLEAPGATVLIPNAKAHTEILVVLAPAAEGAEAAPAPAVSVAAKRVVQP